MKPRRFSEPLLTGTAMTVRRELAAIARRLARDELEVIALIARRLDAGRARYSAPDVTSDRRGFRAEAFEEVVDALAYLSTALLCESRRGARSADCPAVETDSTPLAVVGPLGASTATIRRSDREQVRVIPTAWKAKRLTDVRLWRLRDGEWIPEKRGIAFRPEELLRVAEGLTAAYRIFEAAADENESGARDSGSHEPGGAS